MPGIDGIETIKQLRPMFPHIVFILATAYERFDIAQKAIHLSVFSYLVKPVSRNKILEELEKVKKHLDQRKRESENHRKEETLLEKTRNEKRQNFLSSLIWRNPDEEKWDEFCRLFSISSERAAIYLVGGLSGISEEIRNDIYKEIIKKIQYKYNCIHADIGDKLLLFFPEERELKNLGKQFREILNDLEKYNPVLGSGKVYHFSEITNSFLEAFQPFSDVDIVENKRNGEQRRILSIYRNILSNERSRGE